MSTSTVALQELNSRIASTEALLEQAKAVLETRERDRLDCTGVIAELKRLKEVLDDLQYQRRRLQRFEDTGWGSL